MQGPWVVLESSGAELQVLHAHKARKRIAALVAEAIAEGDVVDLYSVPERDVAETLADRLYESWDVTPSPQREAWIAQFHLLTVGA